MKEMRGTPTKIVGIERSKVRESLLKWKRREKRVESSYDRNEPFYVGY